jgi:hypothetical protein
VSDLLTYAGEPLADVDTEIFCAAQAEAIRVLGKRVVGDIIEIGQRLIAVKQRLPHGQWLPWLEDEFGWTARTATNYMAIADAFGSNSESLSDLNISAEALYLLAGPAIPMQIRETAVELAQTGEHITKAKAEEMIAEAVDKKEQVFRGAFRKIEEEQAAQIEAAIAEATKELASDNKALTKRIAEIRARKPEITTIAADLCRVLNRQKLGPDQWRWLAQILGETIAVGKRTYQPISKEELAANEENLRIASALTSALETLAGVPPVETMQRAVWPVQRDQHRKVLPQVIEWLSAYRSIIEQA